MSKIDKVIEYFRNLREDAAAAPTMNTGSVVGGPAGFSADSNASGPVAGFSGVLGLMRRAKRKAKRKKRSKS